MPVSRKPDKARAEEEEVTLASSAAGEAAKLSARAIADDDTTGHDTTTHERRRHHVKPIAPSASEQDARLRVRTLRSLDAPKRPKSRWFWGAVVALIGGGALTAWRVQVSLRPVKTGSTAATAVPTAAPTDSVVVSVHKLWLNIDVQPSTARVQIDGKPMAKTKDVELELPCPKGFHELRVEADDHEPTVKRIPCEGRVVMDLSLGKR